VWVETLRGEVGEAGTPEHAFEAMHQIMVADEAKIAVLTEANSNLRGA
jgi:hypothetical protein